MMASCKNTKTTEPTPEEIQAQKVALADSVLAQIDSLIDTYIDYSVNNFDFRNFKLDEAEMLIKPDYLLDPSEADGYVTKSQKINALAIYGVDLLIRSLYDMPLDEAKGAMAKLAAELNHPIDFSKVNDMTRKERIKKEYEICKGRGDLAYFWQFQYAVAVEIIYVLSHNADLFFSKITEEQWQSFYCKLETNFSAICSLAQHDEEMSALNDFMDKVRVTSSDKERGEILSSIENSKHYFTSHIEQQAAIRNALLQ